MNRANLGALSIILSALVNIEIVYAAPGAANDNLVKSAVCSIYLTAGGRLSKTPTLMHGTPPQFDQPSMIDIAANGHLIRVDRNHDGQLFISRYPFGRSPSRAVESLRVEPEEKLLILKAISPDAQFLILKAGRDIHLISTTTGRALHQFTDQNETLTGSMAFRFSDDSIHLTVTEIGYVSSFRMTESATHALDRRYVGDTRSGLLAETGWHGMSSAQRIGETSRYVAFYAGLPPLILDFRASSGLSIIDLPMGGPSSHWGEGFISERHRLIVAFSLQRTRGRIDLIQFRRLKLIRSFDVPPDADLFALSPDGRWLMAARPLLGTVMFFDLDSSSASPAGELHSGRTEIGRVQWIGLRTVAISSAKSKWVNLLRLPESL